MRTPRRVLTVLERDEIRAMEDAAGSERDKLIVRVLADTGLRLSELLGLTAGDLIEQGRDRYVKVMGKGSRERLVPLQPALYVRLRRFAANGARQETSSDRIFTTAIGYRARPRAEKRTSAGWGRVRIATKVRSCRGSSTGQ